MENNQLKEASKKRKHETKGALDQCYDEAIKPKLNGNAALIAEGLCEWYMSKNRQLPQTFQLNQRHDYYLCLSFVTR